MELTCLGEGGLLVPTFWTPPKGRGGGGGALVTKPQDQLRRARSSEVR